MRVFITGATRGIGRSIIHRLAARSSEGDIIYLGCRDVDAGDALAAGSAHVIAVRIDVTDAASVAAAVARVAVDGPLDALVNNAGVMCEREGCELSSAIEPTLRVNLDGVITVTEAFLPLLREGAHVVNVSSGAGTRMAGSLSETDRAALDAANVRTLRQIVARLAHAVAAKEGAARPGETPIYGLSKAALNWYTQLVARQAPNLCVNACSPGFCRTEIAGANVEYTREPKDAALGADVVVKLLHSEIGRGSTGAFFKEVSKPGTPLDAARSVVEPWIAL
jgi:NAD(P)-dependent dehydrogenase (short-subunit alcohol dehydrogenase family)